jgi:hypothetical protein
VEDVSGVLLIGKVYWPVYSDTTKRWVELVNIYVRLFWRSHDERHGSDVSIVSPKDFSRQNFTRVKGRFSGKTFCRVSDRDALALLLVLVQEIRADIMYLIGI